MIIQIGNIGLNCSVDFTEEEFKKAFGKSLSLESIDYKDAYKKYRKYYDKLNPKVVEKDYKKKKKKEA